MDSSIHYVKEISITSRDLGETLGKTTCIKVSSRPIWSEEVITEEITLFSEDRLITSINGKTINHDERS